MVSTALYSAIGGAFAKANQIMEGKQRARLASEAKQEERTYQEDEWTRRTDISFEHQKELEEIRKGNKKSPYQIELEDGTLVDAASPAGKLRFDMLKHRQDQSLTDPKGKKFGGFFIADEELSGNKDSQAIEVLDFLNSNWGTVQQFLDNGGGSVQGLNTSIANLVGRNTSPSKISEESKHFRVNIIRGDDYENLPEWLRKTIDTNSTSYQQMIKQNPENYEFRDVIGPNEQKQRVYMHKGRKIDLNSAEAQKLKNDGKSPIVRTNRITRPIIVNGMTPLGKDFLTVVTQEGNLGLGNHLLSLQHEKDPIKSKQISKEIENELVAMGYLSDFTVKTREDEGKHFTYKAHSKDPISMLEVIGGMVGALAATSPKDEFIYEEGASFFRIRENATEDLAAGATIIGQSLQQSELTADLIRDLTEYSNSINGNEYSSVLTFLDWQDKYYNTEEGPIAAIVRFAKESKNLIFGENRGNLLEWEDFKNISPRRQKIIRELEIGLTGDEKQNELLAANKEQFEPLEGNQKRSKNQEDVARRTYRKLLATKLTYQLAAYFQGGAGGRMISDQDFRIIARSLFQAPTAEAQIHALEMLKAKMELSNFKAQATAKYGKLGIHNSIINRGEAFFNYRYQKAMENFAQASGIELREEGKRTLESVAAAIDSHTAGKTPEVADPKTVQSINIIEGTNEGEKESELPAEIGDPS